ncbi:MAG: hypothetical protein ACI3V0_08530 [Faecousia sp.]
MDNTYIREHTDTRGIFHQPWHGRKLPPPPKVNEMGAEIRRKLSIQGVRSIYQPDLETIQHIQRAVEKVWYLFPHEITGKHHPPIIAVYLYDSDVCLDDFKTAGGMCSTWFGENGYTAIGIERAYLDAEDDDLAFILLHEFAHAFAPKVEDGHAPEYHSKLDLMIQVYNNVYRTKVKNDYWSFNGECKYREIL